MADNMRDVGTVVVVNEEDKILVLRRSAKSRGKGFWNFPGGGIEEDESIEEGAIRELEEEASLTTSVGSLDSLGWISRGSLAIHFFITDDYEGEVEINWESDEFKWVTIEELDQLLFVGGGSLHPALVGMIKEFVED